MDEPDWAEALAVMYRSRNVISAPYDLSEIPEDHELVQGTTMAPSDVGDGLRFLSQQGLIEMNKFAAENPETDEFGNPVEFSHREIELKSKGFDVAHERELSLRENAGNYAVTALTAILALGSIAQVVVAYASESLSFFESVTLGVLLLGLIVLLYYFWSQLRKAGAIDIEALIERQKRLK